MIWFPAAYKVCKNLRLSTPDIEVRILSATFRFLKSGNANTISVSIASIWFPLRSRVVRFGALIKKICFTDVSLYLAIFSVRRLDILIASSKSTEFMLSIEPDKSKFIRVKHLWRAKSDGKFSIVASFKITTSNFGNTKQSCFVEKDTPTYEEFVVDSVIEFLFSCYSASDLRGLDNQAFETNSTIL